MTALEFLETLQKALQNLKAGDKLPNSWEYTGEYAEPFGSQGGTGEEKKATTPYQFKKANYTYNLRAMKGTTSPWISIDAQNYGQVLNFPFDKKTFHSIDGTSKVVENYIMTIGRGRISNKDAETAMLKENPSFTGVICEFIDSEFLKTPLVTLTKILDWAVLRESVKKQIKKERLEKNKEEIIEEDDAEEIVGTDENAPKFPLNQILYGAPGTGKTYHTVALSVQIAENLSKEDFDKKYPNQDTKEGRKKLKDAFDALLIKDFDHAENKQIAFTTFHQSMSYEDFVEGIKPITHTGQVQYDVVEGVFQRLARIAVSNYEHSKSVNTEKLSFEEALFILTEEWEEKPNMEFQLKKEGHPFSITGFKEKNIPFKKASGGEAHGFSIATLRDLYYSNRAVDFNMGIWRYYLPILNKLNSYQVKSNSINKKLNYILLIDEINRGNVSQIFGELITLIEESKRAGNDEELSVTLPYSKESFSVPNNLYIIGTMNTADRSVEALDTALRRRFSFVEMEPQPDLLVKKVEDIDLKTLLKTINDRIELLLDKDHCIGHSYFMNVDSVEGLRLAFMDKILPLLQEYFYGDWEKIAMVLSPRFIKKFPETDKVDAASIFFYGKVDRIKHSIRLAKFDNLDTFQTAVKSIYQRETNTKNE